MPVRLVPLPLWLFSEENGHTRSDENEKAGIKPSDNGERSGPRRVRRKANDIVRAR